MSLFNADESGDIEAYGSGFGKIKIECDKHNAPYPILAITPNGVTIEIKACELYMKLLKYGRYWKTYPDNAEDSSPELDKYDYSTTQDHPPVEVEPVTDPETIRSIDRMMEILSSQLSDEEKELYLPIAEFFKTHDVIKNPDVVDLIHKSAPTANRYLARLVQLGIIVSEGNTKGRIYRRV